MSEKTQQVRAVDVWILGPLMIFLASRKQIPAWGKVALGIAGALTIFYNGRNYLSTQKPPASS